MFNPDMMRQAQQNMTPENLNMANEAIGKMSDEELRNMAKMTGMNIDPSFLKMASQQLNSMSPEQRANMVNQTKNMNPQQFQQKQQQFQQQQNQSKPATQTQQQEPASSFPTISFLKTNGNSFFKSQKYNEAGTNYYEAIMEIEEIKLKSSYESMSSERKKELQELDISCRLNYCNVKQKQNDYESVRMHAKEVVKMDPKNPKGNFRLGQALFQFKKYELAYEKLKIAKDLLSNDASVQQLFKDCEKEYQNITKQTQNNGHQEDQQSSQQAKNIQECSNSCVSEPIKESEPSSYSKQFAESQQDPDENLYKKKIKKTQKFNDDLDLKIDEKELQQLKEKSEKRRKEEEQMSKSKQQAKEELVIEEEKSEPIFASTPHQHPSNNQNKNDMQKKTQEAQSQLKNMSDDQLEMMANQMKNIDKGFFKNMYKQQMGMDLSDADIDRMQSMMNTDTLKMMKNMDPSTLDQMKPPITGGSSNISQNNFSQPEMPKMPTNMSDMGDMMNNPQIKSMMNNPEMIKNMMGQLKSNPDMLKNISSMMGPNNPMASYLEKSSPEDLEKMMNTMQKFSGIIPIGIKAYQFFSKYKMPLLAGLVVLFAYIFVL